MKIRKSQGFKSGYIKIQNLSSVENINYNNMEYINYISEDVNSHLSNYSNAELLPGSMKNIYNNELPVEL